MDNVIELPRSEKSDDPFAPYNTPECKLFFPVGERKVAWETRHGGFEPTNSHKAIIRLSPKGDSAMLLNIVGAAYKLVHNRELFSAVEQAMHDEMLPEHLLGVQVADRVSGWGKVCLRQYIFPAIKCHIQHTKSDVAFRIIVQNGYGGSALRIHAGAIDFYCSNGMIRGEYTSTYRKHTSGLVVGHLNATVKTALQEFANGAEQWNTWANKPIRFEQAMKLFEHIALSAKMRDSLNDQLTREVDARGNNMWALYSTLTYYASHNDGAFGLRRTVEEQDTVATTMLGRELNVAKWVQSDAWRELETA
jgi:hypothetical protein